MSDDLTPEERYIDFYLAVDDNATRMMFAALRDMIASLDAEFGRLTEAVREIGGSAMSEATTGATPEQIEAAVQRFIDNGGDASFNGGFRPDRLIGGVSPYLVPPDHRIIGPDEIAAIRNIMAEALTYQCRQEDIDRVIAMIEGAQ